MSKGAAVMGTFKLLMHYPAIWRQLQRTYAALSFYRAKTYDTPVGGGNKQSTSTTERTALFLVELYHQRRLLSAVRRWIDRYCTTPARQRVLIGLWRYKQKWDKVAAFAGLSPDDARAVAADMTANLEVWLHERGFMFDNEAAAD